MRNDYVTWALKQVTVARLYPLDGPMGEVVTLWTPEQNAIDHGENS